MLHYPNTMAIHETALREWLIGEGRRPSTIEKTLAEARLLHQHYQAQTMPANRLRWTARRLLTWNGTAGAFRAFLESVANLPNPPRRRQREATSIDAKAWSRLIDVLQREDTLEAAATQMMVDTGLRVGDVFRIDRRALERAIIQEDTDGGGAFHLEVKGGGRRVVRVDFAPEACRRLLATWLRERPRAKTFARALCPDSEDEQAMYDCARMRMSRALKRYATVAKVPGRIFTHRIRRTVIVQALQYTNDIQAAQQLAGHRNVMTTMKYTDEPRLDDVSNLLGALRAKRLKGPKR